MPGIRYRAPSAPSTALISQDGYDRLRAELDLLWVTQRPEVVAALSAAAAEGDRSENAEYIYRKRQLAEIDRRVRYLSKRLKSIRIVQALPFDTSRIYFGAYAALEDEDGGARCVRIVGPDETSFAEPRVGYERISIDAPLARALMKKQIDDEVLVALPHGAKRYFIVGIDYAG
jgi:transcription elongation factor GreB